MIWADAEPATARSFGDARGVTRLDGAPGAATSIWRYDNRGRLIGAVRRGPNSILFYDRRGHVTRAIRLHPARRSAEHGHGPGGQEPVIERVADRDRAGLFGHGPMGPGWKRLDFGRFAGGVGRP